MSTIVPADTVIVVNAFRLQANALASCIMIVTTKPTDAEELAALVQARAPELVDRAAAPNSQLILTLNLIDAAGQGGCSWQCLSAGAAIERAAWVSAIGAYLAEMTMHAAQCHASTPAAVALPRVLN